MAVMTLKRDADTWPAVVSRVVDQISDSWTNTIRWCLMALVVVGPAVGVCLMAVWLKWTLS
jgi:hypothetical protein